MSNLNIQSKTNDFTYITFKMQASMHGTDEKFYGLEYTVKRISSFVFSCASGNYELLESAKIGMIEGFNKLKQEENIPILCYETIEYLIQSIDERLQGRIAI